MNQFDYVVVGAGLFGCATALQLADRVGSSASVALIGSSRAPSSHNDAARVTLLHSKNDDWRERCRRSMIRMLEIEQRLPTEKRFLAKVGTILICNDGQDPFLQHADPIHMQRFHEFASIHDVHTLELPESNAQSRLSNTVQSKSSHSIETGTALAESSPSGSVAPHAFIDAHIGLLKARGGTFIDSFVVAVDSRSNSVRLESGHTISATRALALACGPLTNHLLMSAKQLAPLPLILKGETVLLAEVQAGRYDSMPSCIWNVDTKEYEGVYAIGPRRYSDGKYYVKMGANLPSDRYFRSGNEVRRWLSGKIDARRSAFDRAQFKALRSAFDRLYGSSLNVIRFSLKRCVLTRTPNGDPIVQRIAPNIVVCVGGNGYGAMTACAIGEETTNLLLYSSKL